MSKATVIFSGGLDSTTVLYKALQENDEVHAITFFYNQRHSREVAQASLIASKANIEHRIVDLSFFADLAPTSALTNEKIKVPEGHYEDESMKDTVVANRNMTFASIAAAYAIARKHDKLYLGVHAGDHAIYPDCTPEFIGALNIAIGEGNKHDLQIVAPYLYVDKAAIVKEGLELNVPYELTQTCYNGNELACGVCGSCNERLEAFAKNKASDPVNYALPDET